MIGWNGDGKIDGEEIILTEIILTDEEKSGGGSSGKPNGSCLTLLVLMVAVPAFIIDLFR